MLEHSRAASHATGRAYMWGTAYRRPRLAGKDSDDPRRELGDLCAGGVDIGFDSHPRAGLITVLARCGANCFLVRRQVTF